LAPYEERLEEQAGGPIANPGEMAFTHELAVGVITSIPQYVDEFEAVFKTRTVDIDRITEAIAAFEETLVTPNSRFDRWLLGDDAALTAAERDGYRLFKTSGCVACHNGPAAGGTSFRKMGVVEPYRTDNLAEGRAAVTGRDADRFNFKVPTMRNVELTFPYFHDGAAETLAQAVEVMGRVQLGRRYSDEENAKITVFLKTLTGDQPSFRLPLLPPSSDKTPRPNPFQEGCEKRAGPTPRQKSRAPVLNCNSCTRRPAPGRAHSTQDCTRRYTASTVRLRRADILESNVYARTLGCQSRQERPHQFVEQQFDGAPGSRRRIELAHL
jgi:cytochrome c peroxidase